MDMVLMHHLVKKMNCGPDRFHMAMLPSTKYLGVITEGVKDWSMASLMTRNTSTALLNEKKTLTSTAFLLTFLTELGRFGNIPNNKENWGFISGEGDGVPYPRMSLVDFSRSGYCRDSFSSRSMFTLYWKDCLSYFFHVWQPLCGSYEDLQLFRDRTADLRKALLHNAHVEDQIQHFPFLQSRQALVDLLQSCFDEAALWLHIEGRKARATLDIHRYSDPARKLAEPCAHKTLKAFRHGPRPDMDGLHDRYNVLLCDYSSLVNEWNLSLEQLLLWFPFPNKDDSGMNKEAIATI